MNKLTGIIVKKLRSKSGQAILSVRTDGAIIRVIVEGALVPAAKKLKPGDRVLIWKFVQHASGNIQTHHIALFRGS